MEKEERNRALIRFDNIKEETITNQILLMVTNDFLFQFPFIILLMAGAYFIFIFYSRRPYFFYFSLKEKAEGVTRLLLENL